jgi:hypothetical protein
MDRLLLGMAWILSLVLALLGLVIGPLVTYFLPDYTQAVGPARVFVFTGVAQGLMLVAMLGSVAADRQHRVPLITAAALLTSTILSWAVLELDLGLVGLAAVSLTTRLAYALVLTALGRPRTTWRENLRFAAGLALPVVAACGLVNLVAS